MVGGTGVVDKIFEKYIETNPEISISLRYKKTTVIGNMLHRKKSRNELRNNGVCLDWHMVGTGNYTLPLNGVETNAYV